MAGDPRHHDYTQEPRHPSGIIPTDYDFGKVIGRVLDGDPSSSIHWMRVYDGGIKNFLKCVWQLHGRTLPVIKASPMNAFGEYADLLVREGHLKRSTGEDGSPCFCSCADKAQNQVVFNIEQLSHFPLPYVSYHDAKHEVRDGRNANFPVRNMRFVDTIESKTNEAMRGITYMRYPTPMKVVYQVDLWAKYEQHAKWLAHQLQVKFWDVMCWFWIEHPHPTSREARIPMLMPIKLAELTNTTELTRGDDEDKVHRWTATLEVEAWIFHDELLAPTVQILGKEFLEESGEILGGTVERLTDLAPTPLSEQDTPTEAPPDPGHV